MNENFNRFPCKTEMKKIAMRICVYFKKLLRSGATAVLDQVIQDYGAFR